MKKKILSLLVCSLQFIFLSHNHSQAQNIAINNTGTAANSFAILDIDISTNNMGIFIPRLTTVQRTAIAGLGAAEEGLTVYDETTNSYWLWNGTIWVEFLTSVSSGWLTTGNAATVDGTHFLGTTDNIPLNIRVNNVKAGRIDNTLANTFWGYLSGNAITTGNNNTAVGQNALSNNTVGYQNTSVGSGAMQNTNDIAAFNNVAVGYSALTTNTSGSSNTAIGALTLQANTTANGNTAVGHYSMNANTVGYRNTAVGGRALQSNLTGDFNTAIGSYAMENSDRLSENVAVGYQALQYQSHSTKFNSENVAIGVDALQNNNPTLTTNGLQNTAVGNKSSELNTTGSYNTAIGYRASNSNLTGSENTAVGMNALYYNTADYNTALGVRALVTNTAGAYNTGIGRWAIYYNATGSNNTAVGHGAGFGVTGNSHSNNSFLGYQVGSGITTGSNNIALGYNAGYAGASNLTSGSNNIVIGYNIDAPNGTSSNQLTLGNIVYGTGLTSTGTTVSTGSVGVGINAPASKLHAAGQISTGIPLGGLGGAAAANGSLRFYNSTNTNTVTLQTGVTTTSYSMYIPTAQGGASTYLINDGAGNLSWGAGGPTGPTGVTGPTGPATGWATTGNTGTTPGTNYAGTTDAVDFVLATSGTEKMRVLNTGGVSFGVASTSNGSIIFNNSTNANTVTFNSGVTSPSYSLTLPVAQGAANSYLKNNGSGALSWSAFTPSQASVTTSTTTTSTTDVLMGGMTITTPAAGDYLIFFSSSFEATISSSTVFVSIYVGGTQQAHTERRYFIDGSILSTAIPVATQSYVTGVTGVQDVEIRWRVTSGTATTWQRTLTLLRIN